jgi:hypothetical protein
MNLLEFVSKVNTDLLVIDTELSTKPGSILEVKQESIDSPRNSCDYPIIMHPSRAAVVDMVKQFGYSVVVLPPNFRIIPAHSTIAMADEERSCVPSKPTSAV